MGVDLVYRFTADLTEVVPVGLVPEGIRLDAHFTGSIVEGLLHGAQVRGVDYLLLRSDGVGVINVYEVVTTTAGEHVSVHAQGYVVPPDGMSMPPPDVMLGPRFKWPDVPLPMHGFALCRTGAKRLSAFNRTALAFEGTANVGTRKLEVSARAVVPVAVG